MRAGFITVYRYSLTTVKGAYFRHITISCLKWLTMYGKSVVHLSRPLGAVVIEFMEFSVGVG